MTMRRIFAAAAMVAGLGFGALGPSAEAASVSNAPIAPAIETAEGRVMGDIVIGDANAPVTIVEYASFTCPYCARFHNLTYPEIKAKYIDTGKAKLIMREVYFDQFGLLAAAIARCGGEGRYPQFLDVLYKKQRDWTASGDRATTIAAIRQIGLLAGLGSKRVDACLTDRDYHRTLVETYQKVSEADQIKSTPTFLVNGEEVRGAVSPAELSAVIDRYLAE